MAAATALPRLTLHYFNIHGLGARIRLACAVGGLALEDRRFKEDRSDFLALKESKDLPFGQAPLLVVRGADGVEHKLAQSSAILRYVCTLGGLHLWGIAVGLVISGEYFGWSYGWAHAGTLGFLVTTVFIALMYTTFIFSYTELTTAIPHAGGPFAYSYRAFGPAGGYVAGQPDR